MAYNRNLAVDYALKWALNRNPQFYNYEKLGGDCTNFISQCLLSGNILMDYNPLGWYYINANNKSASWTSSQFLFEYLFRECKKLNVKLITKSLLKIGDLIFLSFDNKTFSHTLIVSKIENGNIYICSHTLDSKNRNLNTYYYKKIIFVSLD